MPWKSQNAAVQVRSYLVGVELLRLQPELQLMTPAFSQGPDSRAHIYVSWLRRPEGIEL